MDPAPAGASPARRAAIIVALAAAYYEAAKLGLSLAFVNASATAVWPPTGIAVASVLLLSPRVWPGIFLGAFLANLTTAGSVLTSAGIAAGNTLEALTAWYLVTRFAGGAQAFERADRIFRYALVVAVATMVSATIGVTTLVAGRLAAPAEAGAVWLTWWFGDASGALIVAPFLLLWAARPAAVPRVRLSREGVALFLAVLVVAWIVFSGLFAFEYLTVPLLAWAAFRFGPRETVTAVVLLAALAIWGTTSGRGPFLAGSENTSLLLVQAFMALMALVHLPVAALVAERKEIQRQLGERERRFRRLYEQERETTEILQQSLLPSRFPSLPGIDVSARYLPATPVAVGGDWYDVLLLPDGRVGLAIGDVAGRGLEAATVMGKIRNALRAYALDGHGPAQLLRRLNRLMEPGEMATLLYLVVDLSRERMVYASAGHPPALVVRPDESTVFLEGSGPPLGVTLGQSAVSEYVAGLAQGSSLILYTDGLVEGRTSDVDAGLRRLRETAARAPRATAGELAGIILAAGRGEVVADDAALLVAWFEPLDPARLHVRLPAIPTTVTQLRDVLRRWLNAAGVPASEASEILVATGEACTNAVEHAYGLESATVDVEAHREAARLTVTVRDEGAWRPPRRGRDGGRGLPVMNGLMDEVRIDAGAAGTTVTLVKVLQQTVPA